MFQGTHDVVVPLDAARGLRRALEAAGVPVVYVEFPWTEHAFDLMYPPLANPAARAALYDLERFLACVACDRSESIPMTALDIERRQAVNEPTPVRPGVGSSV
jgi:acetyl esterase/lipase